MSRFNRSEKSPLKSWLYKLVGIFVSIFFVYLAVRKVDLSESLRVLGSVQPIVLAMAVLVYLTGYGFRTLRWRRILWAQKQLSLRQTVVPVFVGYMANNVLPARTGEVYRAHFLGRRARMSRSGAAASIVVERAFDGLMLVLFIVLVFLLFPQQRFLGVTVVLTGVAFVVLALLVFLYVVVADKVQWFVDRMVGILPPSLGRLLSVRLELFLRGIRGVSTIEGGLKVGAYTAVIWLCEAGAITLAVLSFGVILPPGGYLLVYALAALSTTIPAGPGYVGPYQYAFVLALGVFAVSRETALAISVAAQLALLGSVTLIGLALLWREQLRGEPMQEEPKKPERSVA
ncbi:lysylphosphatidylglycerol synthase transmembrane domain-containing protein [soil metagenome]